MIKKTKREWIEWFKSLDDDLEIELRVGCYSKQLDNNGKLKKIVLFT